MVVEKSQSDHIVYKLEGINTGYASVRTEAIVRLAGKYLKGKNSEISILDVACGRGELLSRFSELGYNSTGLDYDQNCVDLAAKYTECIQGDALKVSDVFNGRTFDLVTCSHFLEHTENPKMFVKELAKVSGKYILIAVPNLAQFITLEHKDPVYVKKGHLCGWDPAHFKTFLEIHCGLKIVSWECDQVIIPLRPLWKKIPLINKLFRWFEIKMLPKILPYLSSSLIVICEKNTENE